MPEKPKLMIVAGEPSGDVHAANLVKSLRLLQPDAEFFGATGENLRRENVETIVNADDLAIVGLPEIIRALPMFLRTFSILKKTAVERRPNAVILVDFPEFNLRLAKSLKKAGLKVIYYISPQLWAWRKYRVKTIKNDVDLLLTILPFEKDWYAKQGVRHVEFVGNPLAGEVFSKLTKEEFCAKHKLDLSKPIIALLPGSRRKEITHILPVLFETAFLMSEKNNEIQFLVAASSEKRFDEIKEILRNMEEEKSKINMKIICGETKEVLSAADAAAVTSGTATLETAIIGTPLAVVYRGTNLNYRILRPLIDVPHFGLVNLIAGERLAKEFIQHDLTKENLAAELFRLLQPKTNEEMRKKLKEVAGTLGTGASERAAEEILKILE